MGTLDMYVAGGTENTVFFFFWKLIGK